MSQGAGRKSQVCAKSAWVQSEYALARWIGVAFVSACMALSAAGAPRESGGGAFTLVVENDLFSANGQDRNYTSGLKAAYLTPAGAEPRWARRLGDILPGYADRLDTRFEFEIGQSTIIFICIAIVNCSSIDIGRECFIRFTKIRNGSNHICIFLKFRSIV